MVYAIEEKNQTTPPNRLFDKNAAQRNIIFDRGITNEKTGKKKWYDMFVPCHEMTLSDNECSTLWNNRCASYVSWTITLYIEIEYDTNPVTNVRIIKKKKK